MMTSQRRHASIGTLIFLGCAAIALPGLVRGSAAHAQTQQQQPIPNEPLQPPNHRYDLPATLLTAAQLEGHKAKMVADKEDDPDEHGEGGWR